MALSNSASGGGGQFVSLYKGYWGKRVDDEGKWGEFTDEQKEMKRKELVESGAIQRKRGGTGENAGEMVWEIKYDTLSGKIKNAYIEEGNFNNQIVFIIDDNGETITAKLKADGVLAESIIKSLPNIDVTQDVIMKAYINKKDHGSLWIEQNGEGVKWAYTKDSPNGIPQPTQKKVKGKDTWDFSEVENFLYDKLVAWCSQFEGKKEEAPKEEKATKEDLEMPF